MGRNNKGKGQNKGWSKERRAKAAERCRANKPWESSTGPKTARGKMRSSLNALKHGGRSESFKNATQMLDLHQQFLDKCLTFTVADTARMNLANELIENRAASRSNSLINNNANNGQGGQL